MKFKLTALVLCLVFVLCTVGCINDAPAPASSSLPEDTESEPEPEKEVIFVNPLTGIKGLSADKVDARPVAVMVNNIKIAQPVQTGLGNADIVYETEVEGGITRLMAVFKDISSAGQIGTVRSARYPYVDLALGHNAVYIHCGADPTYCQPHLKDVDDVSIDSGNMGQRISNGLASEHTLYTFGDKLFEGLKGKFKMTSSSNELWQDFADGEEKAVLDAGACTSISIPFSTSYNTTFSYDASAMRYTRLSGGNTLKDYKTGELIQVKNVFVLLTSISNYPDGKHRKVALDGGDGYYVSNGEYKFIKWSKGAAKSPIKLTDTNGAPLKVNAGNSWVCIADKNTSNPTVQ